MAMRLFGRRAWVLILPRIFLRMVISVDLMTFQTTVVLRLVVLPLTLLAQISIFLSLPEITKVIH